MTTIPTHMTEQLRNELEQLLTKTDQFVANADNANTSEEAKTWIRRAHETQRETRLNNAKDFITQKEDDLIANLANGTDVNPEHIDPTITPVITQHDKDLWKYASLTWSVPVSEGYGRRTKFLVRDRQNGKLIAIFALGDPVIALGPRDDTIGWNKEQRHNRLYNVFDAFVLGDLAVHLGEELVIDIDLKCQLKSLLDREVERSPLAKGSEFHFEPFGFGVGDDGISDGVFGNICFCGAFLDCSLEILLRFVSFRVEVFVRLGTWSSHCLECVHDAFGD